MFTATDRTNRHADKQTQTQTQTRTDRHTDTQTHRHTDTHRHSRTCAHFRVGESIVTASPSHVAVLRPGDTTPHMITKVRVCVCEWEGGRGRGRGRGKEIHACTSSSVIHALPSTPSLPPSAPSPFASFPGPRILPRCRVCNHSRTSGAPVQRRRQAKLFPKQARDGQQQQQQR